MSEAPTDARVEFIKARVRTAFPRVADAKFNTAMSTDEATEKLIDFVDQPEKTFLLVPESLKMQVDMPTRLPRGKCLTFVKLSHAPLEEENIGGQMIVNELSGSEFPFEQLELVANEIFLPVLSNPQNQAKWGEVPTREIMDRFHSFLSSTTILCGQVKGETRLPMPPIDLNGTANGKNRISLLEGAIITWTKQIRNVLKQDPESQLKQGMHPTPDVEIEFWKNKAANLNSIFGQLQGPKIRRVLRALDQAKSTYCTTFARLCKEVFTARIEANDNMKYLRTLEDWFDRLNSEGDFPKIQDLFKPMLHIILLIWKNSKHYNTPARLVVLMREICNSLINQACMYVSGEQIFELIDQGEASTAVQQLKTTLHVCGTFKATYFDYRSTANAECPANPWRIQNNALFMRLDSFLERCHDILDLTQTIVQFSKLEKIEVGGTKGKSLTASIKQIYDDFLRTVDRFKSVSYDIMDVGAKDFDDDFYDFRCSIKELERRLGAVVSLAFDDCATVYGRFKLLDSFEGLLERPIIQDELEKKYVSLVHSYGQDLKTVQELFLQYRDTPPISWNLPPIAGALTWCRGLVDRIQIPMRKLEQLDKTVLEREEAKEVSKVFATIMASLQEYENQKIEEWGRDVEASSQAKLKLPLLLRNSENRLLQVNFDPALVRLLREVKYFLLLGLTVPDSALEIYKQVEVFRRWNGNLDLIVNKNNTVLQQLLAVEKPLVQPYLDKFDRAVERGVAQLNWRSSGITSFIEESMEQVDVVDEVVRIMKTNMGNVQSTMDSWNTPMMTRKAKPVVKEEFEREHKNLIKERYHLLKDGGKEIHQLLKESNKVLRVSNASPDWRGYVDFVNNVVVQGLGRVIYTSLEYLFQQIDPETIAAKDKRPLLEIELTLVGNAVRYQPEISRADGKGVRDLVNGWIGSFFNIATQFKRLDSEGNYMREMHNDSEVMMLLAMINECLSENEDRCMELKDLYEEYSYLWTTDRAEFFAEFCADAIVKSEHNQDLLDLAKFDEAITKYHKIYDTISRFESPKNVGWLRVNTLPIKEQLMSWATKWEDMFTQCLKDTLVTKLTELDEFMKKIRAGTDVEVAEGPEGKTALMAVMADVRDVRKAMNVTAELFEPLQDVVKLLKKHGVDITDVQVAGDDVQDYLEEAPMAWEAVVKKTEKKKEEILPMQQAEVEALKEELEEFYLAMRAFRHDFRNNAPFSFDGPIEEAYSMMDRHVAALFEKEAQTIKYNELEELFELQVTKYPETGDTRSELRMLKTLWDFKSAVTCTYENWRTELWNEVDTEDLQEQNKKLKKQLRSMGNESQIMKGWDVYRNIEEMAKNMEVVLPLVNALHDEAMRDRHWKMLAKVCKVDEVDPSDPKFTLEDMMKLDLHLFVEEVDEIVETAARELKIERKLRGIDSDWKEFVLDYVPHKDSEMFVIKPNEEVIEGLEGHQLELQTMIGMGKFVEYFRDSVVYWQETLGHVEDVLKVWTSVSRSWGSLESIFLASADIRSQLPDDTKRFEGIDSEFKELMKDAIEEPNVVKVCTVEGRLESLQSMSSRLDECQKSLNEYLDQKKKIFPRFYFVSNVALLDMLANGTNPPKIIRYLADCYDALASLRFITNEDGSESTKVVDLMTAKDGEQVPLYENFTLEGEVENYLNALTEAMRTTLRHQLDSGVETAANWEVDKPRHQWLFDYPAQVVVTGTQIYWTEETEAALEEFEGGQEDAVKRYLAACNQRLADLIQLVLGKLAKNDRVKIITLITLDVHARDVVAKLIADKTEGPAAFLWQQQLRFYWVAGDMTVEVKICDFRTMYFYEWIGNTGRLVITPLTDRCYVTLTMGLRLFLGGAPAGPAGTGKTETTKDLARALALPCYVFNCSDQMNYKTMADIFRGLAQVGAWGCFDEFNRIPIEVLSVVATQVKTVQDYLKRYAVPGNRDPEYQDLPPGLPPVKVGDFPFEGDVISLIPTVGLFITMNPGYAGRTELPENIKALFRSCAMIRPDLKPICENMLMSEGFQAARTLAIKFVTLYELSSELLSKQHHYDWGLRAVKSVLRVAGMLKRAEPDLDEGAVLMRALRDFNTPKIPAHDTPIFMRLIGDLFMGLDVQPKLNEDLRAIVAKVAEATKLQSDELFLLKVLQFQELLDVRHSVMLLGPTGCGKTQIWKTLAGAHNWDTAEDRFKTKKTCIYETVNPKAVTGDELYGYMTLAKDWKDGVLSIIMRGMSKNLSEQSYHAAQTYKWVVLDGDIDAVWIESMNTVMDDNKVLTLVSNERVPLSDAMRMIFEINSLKNASPATVSRAGILFINETDVGWKPFMESWIQSREDARADDSSKWPDPNGTERSFLPGLFDKYIDALAEMTRKGYKEVTPLRLINKVGTIMYLLEALLDTVPGNKKTPEVLENLFIFAAVWSFGGPMIVDKSGDYRSVFNEAFSSQFGQKYPKEGMCFDYFFDVETEAYVDWTTILPDYTPVPIGAGSGETPFSQLHVSTVDTVRLTYLINLLARRGRFAMLIGGAGTGKTAIIKEYLRGLDKDVDGFLSLTINMSFFTDSKKLQTELELPIDKRSGRRFGPPATKRLIYFVDDLNLPYVETYGTQNSIALLTQHMQYGTIFDRDDLGFRKEIVDVQYLSAMNPTAGSFEVCERVQRHFATFACMMPSEQDLITIYSSVFAGHLVGFETPVEGFCENIVLATVQLHDNVAKRFLPSAIKFTYNWNMRELTNVFQGLCNTKAEHYATVPSMLRLWQHECERVFADRLLSLPERENLLGMMQEAAKKNFGNENLEEVFAPSNIFTNFANSNTGAYLPITDVAQLKGVLDNRLMEYNDSFTIMDLVLFEQAMEHVCRIARIIMNPGGNAMLIGVGGSGKQSLSRLASFICQYDVRQLQVTSNFKVEDLQEELKEMFKLAGVKAQPLTWLMTDSQIVDEKFLVYINSILQNGWIADLFPKDEIDGLFNGVRSDAKMAGVPDMPDTLLEFLITRVRANLHVVLCFSPVGDTFRVRARRFPGLINCTAIDFFHPWPRDALIRVARRFVDDIDFGLEDEEDETVEEKLKDSLSVHMAEEHLSVTQASEEYYISQRRYNYVTPKSFLELIGFYKHLLGDKQQAVQHQIDRLDVGLSTLRKTAADVAELQEDLKHTMVKVEEKKEATEVLLVEMGEQAAIAEGKKEMASVEAEKANAAASEAAKIEEQAQQELSEAEPAMLAARDAVDCLDKAMLTELKSLPKPPAGVDDVTSACLILVEKEYKNHKWDRAKKMMANVDQFKKSLQDFRGEDISEEDITRVNVFIQKDGFTPEAMRSKSAAAANLCTWVVSIFKFNRIYVKVKPLMDSLEAARGEKAEADASLKAAMDVVAEVEALLADLRDKLQAATAEKQEVEAMAEACQNRLQLAERLVNGLSSENERWGGEIEKLRQGATTLVGDCMVAAGFVSYLGSFDQDNRNKLWSSTWIPDLTDKGVPITEGVDPLDILTNDGHTAQMISEGLPADRISIENGSIISKCKRWPLIIDPQQQGIKWLRNKEAENNLQVIQTSQKNWERKLENAITNGLPIILENISEELDATLDPVLARAIYKRSRSFYLKFAGEEIEYDQNFRMYLQTKLANPHYKPEIAAQCTLINFIATERGLEDQLLAKVVGVERPELEQRAQELQAAFQRYKIQLVQLEDDLLERLANAPDDILSDVPLIEGLEATKQAAMEIEVAVQEGLKTEQEINVARDMYRPQAQEGAMLYFLLTKLSAIDHMYQYSLDSFVTFFFKSIEKAEPAEAEAQRVLNLRESLRMTIYTWVSRGLFERHKLIFLSQLLFNLMKRGILGEDNMLNEVHFQFLLRGPRKVGETNPLNWLPDSAWQSCQALSELEEFAKFSTDLVEAASRFQEWYNHVTPETEKLPLDWAGLDRTPFQKMLVVRCLRPDRMTTMLARFIRKVLPNGENYVDCDAALSAVGILDQSLTDSTPLTPIYFILSAGSNPLGDLDVLAEKYNFVAGQSYHNVSMGQGQDVVAMRTLETAHRNGHWVILNNIHLMPRWLIELEKKLDEFALEGSHSKFRLFLTSEPANSIPIGILSRSVKLTNEPPAGLKANLKRAVAFFSRARFEEYDNKTKNILFGLCHFHAVMLERKTYGPIGFNMMYPFGTGDLRDSAICLENYMENSGGGKIPWQDLRYIFGQIMYGGHIVNDLDRLLANTYLDFYLKDELLDETEMFPFAEDEKASFMSPAPTTHEKYLEHIDLTMDADTPIAFGLHPNAEIEVRNTQSENTFKTLLELQPRAAGGGEGQQSPQQVAELVLSDIQERFGESGGAKFDVEEMQRSLEDAGPYQYVFMQEMDVMNGLLAEIMRSLKELSLGFAGELTMSDSMEKLMESLYMDQVPATWASRAYPSLRPLQSWLSDLTLRLNQLEDWTNNPLEIPRVTWLSGLVNPQSFLTAICQVAAQKNQWELDKLVTSTEVTKRNSVDEIDMHSKEGAYIMGLKIQGARWDQNGGVVEKSMPKEMFCSMPIVNVRAASASDPSLTAANVYQAPVFKTEQRGAGFVFKAQLRTKSPPSRWILAGVALILDVV